MTGEGVRPLPRRDIMAPYLFTTNIRRLASGTYYITLPKVWGLDASKAVSVLLVNRDTGFELRFTRFPCKRGTSLAVYVPKKLADAYLEEDTLVNMTLEVTEATCSAESEREQDQGRDPQGP